MTWGVWDVLRHRWSLPPATLQHRAESYAYDLCRGWRSPGRYVALQGQHEPPPIPPRVEPIDIAAP